VGISDWTVGRMRILSIPHSKHKYVNEHHIVAALLSLGKSLLCKWT